MQTITTPKNVATVEAFSPQTNRVIMLPKVPHPECDVKKRERKRKGKNNSKPRCPVRAG